MWNAPKIVSQLFEPATFCGKVEIGLSSGWSFLEEGGMQGLRGEGRGGNQRLTAWHWLKFVFRQRIKIVPTLPSRRGRYSITHVNCRIKGKRERERERKRWRNIDSWMRMHPRDEFIPDVFVNGFERGLKLGEFKSMKIFFSPTSNRYTTNERVLNNCVKIFIFSDISIQFIQRKKNFVFIKSDAFRKNVPFCKEREKKNDSLATDISMSMK